MKVVYRPSGQSSALDTKTAVETLLAAGVDLVLFCGGDGTARALHVRKTLLRIHGVVGGQVIGSDPEKFRPDGSYHHRHRDEVAAALL